MKRRFYDLLLAVFLLLATAFQVKAQTPPTTSTAGNEVWYYIQCLPRSADLNAKWLTGAAAGEILTNTVLAENAEEHLWKVVENGGGIALVNKKFGTYMNADQIPYPSVAIAESKITCVTAAPTTALKLESYVDQSTSGVPGGFYLVNLDAVAPITNTANASVTFQFYSAGSGFNSPINYGTNAPNINSAIKFMTPKQILADAIAAAQKGYDNSSEGLNPGQFTPEDREALIGSIEAARETHDAAATTNAGYITATLTLNSIFAQFKSQVILPELSSDNNEVWYYIQGTRPENTYMTAPAAGAGTQVKDLPVIPDDTQLWKLVSNGDGFAMQNKASQEYLQTDFETGTNLNTQSAMPTSALRFITSGETFNKAYRFWIENTTSSTPAFRLHAGGSGNGWGLMNWTGGANDNCTWLFLSEDEVFRAELLNVKTKARAVYDASIEGDEFGQFSAAKRTAFNTILTAEEAKNMATMTQEELKASAAALNTAMENFVCNSDLTTLSSVVKKKWFRLVNNMSGTGYASNKAMSSNGRTVEQKFTYEVVDTNSDAQLFRFELNGDGTKATAIVNKSPKVYVGADGKILDAAPDVEFEITSLDNISFWIKPVGSDPLHAAASGVEILNWNSGAGSASAWRFEYVSSEDITDFSEAYLAKRVQLRAKVNAALEAVGVQFGQYTAASVSALEAVLVAEEAKDASTLTQEQMKNGILAMDAANAVGLVVNTDVKLLKSSAVDKYKWLRLINNMSGTGYAAGKAMSSNGRLDGEAFTWEDRDVTSDAQLFRFELTADETKVAHIVNKASGMHVTVDGLISSTSTAGNDFEITQLGAGRSFWIYPTKIDDVTDPENPARYAPLHAAYDGSHIVNWEAGAGSASAWLFEFVIDEASSVKDVLSNQYKVRTLNNIITVDGVENFEVYSATGQKQNHKAPLMSGVYVVRVNNYLQKVVLK